MITVTEVTPFDNTITTKTVEYSKATWFQLDEGYNLRLMYEGKDKEGNATAETLALYAAGRFSKVVVLK